MRLWGWNFKATQAKISMLQEVWNPGGSWARRLVELLSIYKGMSDLSEGAQLIKEDPRPHQEIKLLSAYSSANIPGVFKVYNCSTTNLKHARSLIHSSLNPVHQEVGAHHICLL